ncbi:2Fe-2S iron-sulfur cluster-binding protein [Paractinoplanes deccanensis]|uniref:2Fe-2S iron-sulfur cluster-binding protein n=1 Tax=Paractinoplanes deccanensis TaxID=113561 RepID=UPI00194320B8|nr:2Fe-2S iron-sulfur cluster-binding protein [Actinoplanes deccanensis]
MTLTIDGRRQAREVDALHTLADVLCRRGCYEGTCGTCAVTVGGETVRSCLMLAVQCEGAHVRTAADPAPREAEPFV